MNRHRSIFRDFVNGLLLAIVLMLLKGMLEQWEFGKQLEQMTYSMLQMRLFYDATGRDLPITVVDICGLAPLPAEYGGRTELVTPRGPLMDIIKGIARHKPRGIGIDLNLSPGPAGYITSADSGLLQSLLQLRQEGTPTYVGIYESVVLPPDKWLGRQEFEPLAAYLTVPNPEHTEPSIRMVEWVQPAGVSKPCPSLSSAMARSVQGDVPSPLHWAVTRANIRKEAEFSASEFLVDYGPLEDLIAQRVPAEDAGGVANQAARIRERLVFVGRGSPGQSTDQFNIPGRGMPVPGIYLHAAATYTLLQAPLYRLTHVGRIAADAFAALLVFVPILLARVYFSRRIRSETTVHRLHVLLSAVVILGILAVGHLLVHWVRLIWTDQLMVIGALLIHSPVERFIVWSLGYVRKVSPAGWPLALLEKIQGKRGNTHENEN
jgi:CHASE2 domain-containing sensor protein